MRAIEREAERRLMDVLTRSGRYRVLKRLEPRPYYHPPDGSATCRALYVDVETTGLGDNDPIIQLAAVPFEFGRACGRIFEVGACETWFEDPGMPIPAAVTRLTGITDADVAGRRLDDARVAQLAADAALVVAHNAAFDRPRLERRLSAFAGKAWACSCHDVPWLAEGLESAKLGWLAYRLSGLYYDAHRADADCLMAVHLLATALPSGDLAMAALLRAARARTARIWATGSPFAAKEALRQRGYRWSGGEGGLPRAWWREVLECDVRTEVGWLEAHAYSGPATISQIQLQLYDARVRHSGRVAARPLVRWTDYAARAAAHRATR